MLKWLLGNKLRRVIESDLLDATSMLATMKLKLHKEGPDATVSYGEGVGEVAGLLAKRFGISAPAALAAQSLDWRQLSDASRDLLEAMENGRKLLKSDIQAVRTAGYNHTFGCLVLYHLYRLRFLTEQAPQEQRDEIRALADRVAAFSRLMAEIAVGTREPNDALI
jgi:hypothetical protein